MTTPRLSICIPTFNREALLRETLNHLREVCDEDIEIAISDNCSPDGTQEVIKSFVGKFRHFRAIRQTENRGAIGNFTAAMSLARGRYLCPLSDDDQIHVDGLQNAVSIMQQNPNIVAVFGGYEEWIRSTGETHPQRDVEQRMDFARGDKLSIFNKFVLLWHPVCRTDIVQRYCWFDKRSLNMWEFVGSLIERGDISIIPDLFYRHAHTEPRMEYELTENWYHDAYRAGFETFIGRMGQMSPDKLAWFLAQRVTPAYTQGQRFARIKGDFLAARHFALRARAYGIISEEKLMAWETENLVGMVAVRLLARVELAPEIDEVVFDISPRLEALRKQFNTIAPKYSVVDVSEDKSLQQGLGPSQFLVTYHHGRLESGALAECESTRWIAVEDLIESCRVTDQPLALDKTGGAATAASIPQPPDQSI
jgi:glycosyltransferase involved in cell wall biosynthesis